MHLEGAPPTIAGSAPVIFSASPYEPTVALYGVPRSVHAPDLTELRPSLQELTPSDLAALHGCHAYTRRKDVSGLPLSYSSPSPNQSRLTTTFHAENIWRKTTCTAGQLSMAGDPKYTQFAVFASSMVHNQGSVTLALARTPGYSIPRSPRSFTLVC